MSALPAAPSVEEIWPGLFRWEVFSPEHKVALTSHAVVMNGRLFCFDPIPLADEAFDFLLRCGQPTALVLTNQNHQRDAARWRERWQVPIWASADAELAIPELRRFQPGQTEWEGWRLHHLHGGGGGELAFHWVQESWVIFGDAVVNLPSRQLELLPAKYCQDPAALRQSLHALIRAPFERMVMAHGQPVRERASVRLGELISLPPS